LDPSAGSVRRALIHRRALGPGNLLGWWSARCAICHCVDSGSGSSIDASSAPAATTQSRDPACQKEGKTHEAAISHHHFKKRRVSHGSQIVQLLSSVDSNPYFGNSVSCSRKAKDTVSAIAGSHLPICSLRNEFCFHGADQFPYAGE
jgi:hypothetical protein